LVATNSGEPPALQVERLTQAEAVELGAVTRCLLFQLVNGGMKALPPRWLKRCRSCSTIFYARRSTAGFCSGACRQKWYRVIRTFAGEKGKEDRA
jgi:hypothetical protein